MISPGEYERYLVKVTDELRPTLPKEALKVYDEGNAEGIPTGIAVHPCGAIAVIMAGQGPMIAWESINPSPTEIADEAAKSNTLRGASAMPELLPPDPRDPGADRLPASDPRDPGAR